MHLHVRVLCKCMRKSYGFARKPVIQDIAVGATISLSLKSVVEMADDAVDAWYGRYCGYSAFGCWELAVPGSFTEL